MQMTFILVQDTGIEVILGNLFTSLLEPFTIHDIEIHTKIKGKEITYKLERDWFVIGSTFTSLKISAFISGNI